MNTTKLCSEILNTLEKATNCSPHQRAEILESIRREIQALEAYSTLATPNNPHPKTNGQSVECPYCGHLSVSLMNTNLSGNQRRACYKCNNTECGLVFETDEIARWEVVAVHKRSRTIMESEPEGLTDKPYSVGKSSERVKFKDVRGQISEMANKARKKQTEKKSEDEGVGIQEVEDEEAQKRITDRVNRLRKRPRRNSI